MRGLFLTVLFSVLLSISYAQSLRMVNTPTKVIGKTGTEMIAPVTVKNISDKPVEIKILRKEIHLSTGQESYFCMGRNCASPSIKVSPETKVLRPGEIYDGFRSVLKTGLGKGNSTISYCFQNTANTSDELCFTLTYQVESMETHDVLFFNDDITISNIYPNPIDAVALFDYTMGNNKANAKIILHNVLGGIVGEYVLNEYENKLKIFTQAFKPGVYFYTLNIDNQNLVTKKFVIKR